MQMFPHMKFFQPISLCIVRIVVNEKAGVAITIMDTLVNTPCPELDSAGEIIWANVSLLSDVNRLVLSPPQPSCLLGHAHGLVTIYSPE